jgi:predicted lipid-binding transport protein (Tim44 family)
MNKARLHRRSGFCGIEILVMVIIIAIISAIFGKAAQPTTKASSQPSATTTQPAVSGETLKETLRAATVAGRVAQAADSDQAPAKASEAAPEIEEPAAIPAPDVPSIDPDPGEGLGEILEDILDGL